MPQSSHALAQSLKTQFGDKTVMTPDEGISSYEIGARGETGRAACVLRPTSTESVSAMIRHCVRHNITLIPQSGNTGLVSGSTPDGSGTQVVLSLDRLRSPFEVNIGNRCVHAGAGNRLSDVNRRLFEAGLFFPIDLGADPMLGGMISTNTGGSRFLRYGDVRSNTLGVKVVLADENGTVLDFTHGLRKNNTGMDWKQVFIGTAGSFGVITECVLNLEPVPVQSATSLLVPRSRQVVIDILRALETRVGPQLSAFESMSGNAIRHALEHVPSLKNPFADAKIPELVLLIELSRSWPPRSGELSIDELLEQCLSEVWELSGAPIDNALMGQTENDWALRHALSDSISHAGHLFAFDLAFRRDEVAGFLDYMYENLPRRHPELQICDFGHVGDGGVHFNLLLSGTTPIDPESYETRLRDWVIETAVSKFGGSFSAEHAIGCKNQRYYTRYTPDFVRRLCSDLKSSVSPGLLGTVQLG